MNALLRTAGVSAAVMFLLVIGAGCPLKGGTQELYLVNTTTDHTIQSVWLPNQQTGMHEDVLGEPIPAHSFQMMRVPLSLYATDDGEVHFKFETGGTFIFIHEVIDGTPLVIVMSGSGQTPDAGLERGGDSFNKVLAGDSAATKE